MFFHYYFFQRLFIFGPLAENHVAPGATCAFHGRHPKRNYCPGIAGKRVLNISGGPQLSFP